MPLFQAQILADLKWVLTSPPLLSLPLFADQTFLATFRQPLWPYLPQLAANIEVVPEPKSLGRYYEWLWQILIEAHPHYQLMAHDLIVKNGKQVIGAADFVVQHLPTKTFEHWELSVKFYLSRGLKLRDWLGTNKDDPLLRKLKRLKLHQIQLLSHKEGLALCQVLGWPISKRRILLQGRLHHHGWITGQSTTRYLHWALNPKAQFGYWYHAQDLPNALYRQLTRFDWLSSEPWPQRTIYQLEPGLSFPQYLFLAEQQAHIFVVPDQW